MAQKLIKACKELNIGMATAIEFFQKQGKSVAADPNTRIDDDLYMLLVQAFNKDMAIKLAADRQAQERQERELNRSVSIEDAHKEEVERARREAEEMRQKAETEKKAAEQARIEAEEQARKEAEERARREAEEQARKEAEERARREAEEQAKAQEEARKKAEEEQRAKADSNSRNADKKKEEKTEIFTLHPQPAPIQPKVVGKIDLDSLNQATRPAKKSKDEKKKEREERMHAQNGGTGGKRKRERIQQNKVDVNDIRNQKGNPTNVPSR